MTWVWRRHIVDVDNVGNDGVTNAYQGDTACSVALPILCLRKEGLPVPSYITPNFYNGWTGGRLNLTPPRLGSELTSRAAADRICEQTFGPGWAMGDHHDGNGGWGWYAYGAVSTTSRFWVAIDDQPANPWNCPTNPPPPTTGRIDGRVFDVRGIGIAGVVVSAGNGQTATTDGTGRYVLSNLPLGTYTLRASRSGWTFGSVQLQNDNYTETLSPSRLSATVGIRGYQFDPVVFVHGWNGGPGNFEHVPGALDNAGYHVESAVLETSPLWTPPFGVNARRVKSVIDRAKYMTGRAKVILYGHSMGGLVSRAYLESSMYEDDVSQIFTYGSPHLGTPPLLSLPCYALPRPDAICQMTRPGMTLFNLTHFKRSDVDYHLIAGDAPMWTHKQVCFRLFRRKICLFSIPWPDLSFRNFGGWAMGALIQGADDAFVQTCSASGMFGSNIDRYLSREVHSRGLGRRDYFDWEEQLSQEGFGQCSRRILIDRSTLTCGNRGWGPPLSCTGLFQRGHEEAAASGEPGATPTLAQRSRVEQDVLKAGERRVRSVFIEGGPTAFSASWEEGTVSFKLIDPTGKVIDPAYAASIAGDPDDDDNVEVTEADPDAVAYSGGERDGMYYVPAARPGTWQLVLEAGSDLPGQGTSFTTGAAFDSPLSAQFSSDRLSYDPGSTATLRVLLSEPVLSADVQVTIRRAGSAPEVVRLARVSASEFAASHATSGPAGYVALDWTITGQRAQGLAFERGGREFIQVHSTELRLGQAHTDRALPRADKPGLNSALAVTLGVLSGYEGGELGAFAELAASDGTVISRIVVSTPARRGHNAVELRFRAEDIYRAKVDGPYTVQNVKLLDERGAPLLSQEVAVAHTTQAYSYRSFAPELGTPSVFLEGPFSVTAGGSLTLTAIGADPEGDELTYGWDLDADGTFEVSGQSVVFTTTLQDPAGLRKVRVKVTDPSGNSATAEAHVDISVPRVNRPPVARCRDVTVSADAACKANDSVNDNSYDPDEADTVSCVQTPGGPYVLGSERVRLTCTDAAGLSDSCEATVTVRDWGQLSLELNGAAELTLECGVDAWKDLGARAWDSCGPLTVQRYNSGQDPYGPGPNTAAEGTYSVQYLASADTGNTVSALRTVRVDDRTAPTLTLRGPSHTTHKCGSAWVDPGVDSWDACYGNLSTAVRRTGDYVNGWVRGVYTARYEVTDSGGNSATPVMRTVEVVDCPW
jgi:hypothetical protein